MKTIVLSLFLSFISSFTFVAYGQEEIPFFAQGLFQIDDKQTVLELEQNIRNNPNILTVRLDTHSPRFFIITQGMSHLSEEIVKSWFGEFSESVGCIQIGVHGQDSVNSYPFNCENE